MAALVAKKDGDEDNGPAEQSMTMKKKPKKKKNQAKDRFVNYFFMPFPIFFCLSGFFFVGFFG